MKKVLLLLTLTALLGACKVPEIKPTKVEYKTLKLEKQDITLHSSFSASLTGQQDVDIIPQASGTLTEIKVKAGQMVRKGQPMFIIDKVTSADELKMALGAFGRSGASRSKMGA